MDVKLDPALQDKCLIDLGKWCSEKTETGQVGGKATCLSRGDNSNAGPDEHLRGLGTVKSHLHGLHRGICYVIHCSLYKKS